MARGALRIVLTVLGGGLLIASAFLDWLAFEDAPKGTEVPIQFLWSPAEREVPEFATSLGLVVIVLGLLAIVGLVPRSGWLTSLAGLDAPGRAQTLRRFLLASRSQVECGWLPSPEITKDKTASGLGSAESAVVELGDTAN